MRYLSGLLNDLIQYKMDKLNADRVHAEKRQQRLSPRRQTKIVVRAPAAAIVEKATAREPFSSSAPVRRPGRRVEKPQKRVVNRALDQTDPVFHRKWFETASTHHHQPSAATAPLQISRINYSVDQRPLRIPKVRLDPACPSTSSSQIHHKCWQVLKLQLRQSPSDSQLEILRRNVYRPTVLQRIRARQSVGGKSS